MGGLVLVEVDATGRRVLLERMADALLTRGALVGTPGLSSDTLVEATPHVEENTPFGPGNGLAFTSARVPGVTGSSLCLARVKEPIDCGAPDGTLTEFAAMMVAPENQPHLAVRTMARLSRMAASTEGRVLLSTWGEPAAFRAVLSDHLGDHDAPILAADLMRPPVCTLGPHMPLREATRTMMRQRFDTVPVVDNAGVLLGEVSCDALYQLGMPDFFGQLKSISFIREFDPFEQYFQGEAGALVNDVMSREPARVTEDATLVEVVFLLSVRRHAKVFVVREDKLVGVIDRILVLDRVINV